MWCTGKRYYSSFKNSVSGRDTLIRCVLALAIFFFYSDELNAQGKQWSEGFWEADISSKPINRHLFELDIVQGNKSDTSQSNFMKYPAYYNFNLWYHYYPTRTMKVSAGTYYGHSFDVDEIGQRLMDEFRLSAVALYNVPARRLYLSHRFALDFRWLQYEEEKNQKIRFRYRLKAIVPLNKKELVKGALFASANEEIFFSKFNNGNRNQLLEQSRTNIGIGYCLTDNIQIEPNYTLALAPVFGSGVYSLSNVYSIRFTLNNLFGKKEK
jgi:hypothetical protein